MGMPRWLLIGGEPLIATTAVAIATAARESVSGRRIGHYSVRMRD